MTGIEPLQLTPIYQPRVWGGRRLLASADEPIGEAWVVYEHNEVASGHWIGVTLADVGRELGGDLLGSAAISETGDRFPLLIKLLDANDWLSVQVHPNDQQARGLEGPDEFGKTEAWHILEAQPGARVVSGLVDSPSHEAIRQAIETGSLEQHLNYVEVSAGDTLFIPAGHVHAIGPGLLLYEVQQASDITYRLFDWNRPASAGRELHLDKGVAVIAAENEARFGSSDGSSLVECPYFILDQLTIDAVPVGMTTGRRSFHALTVVTGEAVLRTSTGEIPLRSLDSVLIPAAITEYELVPAPSARILLARVA